jgi:hypothetical protein
MMYIFMSLKGMLLGLSARISIVFMRRLRGTAGNFFDDELNYCIMLDKTQRIEET